MKKVDLGWSEIKGGIILGILNILLLLTWGKPWGITHILTDWGTWWLKVLGFCPERWAYYQEVYPNSFFKTTLFSHENLLVVGTILGGLFAALWHNEFRPKKIKSPGKFLLGIIGGVFMGFGARLALGCNIGNLVGGIASFSLHGWIFGGSLIIGTYLGILFLKKYVL
ncbi:YeeE/YedE thiosulfate transporter family protein [Carboxydothermus pertinax]|uniref:Uncharacterized protein n=1 Tax=Carboxydothermus pertinax TaxID=870242 RepID=A0A1L8CTM0_9THEO|nr:YeeE/YedE thiosulfate transporter family protein [Carboxydothermus pertinax]GAV22179.1 hypothetical protein cpu_06890 [Carboxydothermus pertinax]